MGRYSAGVVATATAATAGAPLAALKAGASDLLLVEMWIVSLNGPGTGSSLSPRRVTNSPVATASAAGQALDPDDAAATGVVETAWSTVPTASASFLRRLWNAQAANFNNTSIYWTEPEGLKVAAGTWLGLFQDSAPSSALQVLLTLSWDE